MKSDASLSVEDNGNDWLANYNDPVPDVSGDDKDDFDQLDSNEGSGDLFAEGSKDKKRKKKHGKDRKHKKDKKDKGGDGEEGWLMTPSTFIPDINDGTSQFKSIFKNKINYLY